MTVGAFDLNLTHGCAVDVAVAMDVDTGVAVLAEQPPFGIFLTTLVLMMEIIRDKEIVLGMQFGLFITFFVKRRSISIRDQDSNPWDQVPFSTSAEYPCEPLLFLPPWNYHRGT